MSFPPRFLEELRERVSIASIVGRQVKLHRRGREYTGLCPFHTEKTPSFTVSDEKGFYHCFGCGAHGDAISFIVQAEGLSFPEAVERLAGEAGLEVPRQSPREQERDRKAAGLHSVLELACAFFQKQLRLPEGRPALDYLRGRGITAATIERHRLGFAPERRGALAAALQREGCGPDQLVEAGLLKRSEERDETYEYFRGRVIFPITDRRGRVIAFGGRALGDAQPKYLNSPDTPVFNKGRVLYNLAHAREAAAKADEVVVVEGYMDVIALDQAGLPQAVAPLGTALTEEQIGVLWRLAPEPLLCFDGDAAGQRAALRAAERALPLLEPGRSLRFAQLPAGQDPDDLVKAGGVEAVRAVLSGSRALVDVLWETEFARQPVDTPERRAALHKRLDEVVQQIRDPTVRNYYANEFRSRMSGLFSSFPAARRGPGDRFTRPGERFARPGRAMPNSGMPASSMPGLGPRPVPEAMTNPVGARELTKQRSVFATLLSFPELIGEFDEFLADLELPPQLDTLRQELLKLSAQESELDGPALVSHLTRAGFEAIVSPLLRSEGGSKAPVWLRHPDVVQARASLNRIAADSQRKLIELDMRERLKQVDEHAAEQDLEFFVAVSTLERSRTPGEE